MRLGDLDALREAIRDNPYLMKNLNDDNFECILDLINNAPTVRLEYVPNYANCESVAMVRVSRPQGEWYYNYQNGWHCSICHESVKDMPTVIGKADFNFCPNCGAEMKKGDAE